MGNHAGRPGNGELLTAAQGKRKRKKKSHFGMNLKKWVVVQYKMRENENQLELEDGWSII